MSAAKAIEEEINVTTDPVVVDNSCPPQPRQKLLKEQRNLYRKHDLKPVSQPDKQTERAKQQLAFGHGEEEGDKRRSVFPQHAIEVDVEIKTDNSSGEQTPSLEVKPCSKHKSIAPQSVRRKPCANVAAAAYVPPRSPGGDTISSTVPSSPSQASVISETAAEELRNLRKYYGKQLMRINYTSHEHLGQSAETGVLACIREPLRNLCLPPRATIAQTTRSLWTRVSSRRKLVHH